MNWDRSRLNNTELKTANEWLRTPRYVGLEILDPDGWDRRADYFDASWNEKITEKEFDNRVCMSTIMWKFPKL